jgi:hypothetical protein
VRHADIGRELIVRDLSGQRHVLRVTAAALGLTRIERERRQAVCRPTRIDRGQEDLDRQPGRRR